MTLAPRAIILAVALPLLALAGCASAPAPTSDIASVLYSQHQAIQDFDDAEYVQDDPTQLQRLDDLLSKYNVVAGVTDITPKELCDGGRTTTATLTYADDSTAQLVVEPCGDSDFAEFTGAADDLFSEWRDAAK